MISGWKPRWPRNHPGELKRETSHKSKMEGERIWKQLQVRTNNAIEAGGCERLGGKPIVNASLGGTMYR
eukprot:5098197-Prorocentrum_lima.AAC.1